MVNLSDIREKEVINVRNGEKIGYIYDFEIDLERGRVVAFILPGPGRVFSIFGKNNDYKIGWKNIVKIGKDAILVNIEVGE